MTVNSEIRTNNDAEFWMSHFQPFFKKKKGSADINDFWQDFDPRLWYMMRSAPETVRKRNPQFNFPASHPEDPKMFIEFGRRFREEWKKHGLNDEFGFANQYLARIARHYWPAGLFIKDLAKQGNLIKTSGKEILEELTGRWQGVFTVIHLRVFGPHVDKVNGKYALVDTDVIIVKNTKEYIQLLLAWRNKDEWDLKPRAQKGYGGAIKFTYRDLMLWGLVVMLDPLIHDYILEPTRSLSVNETRLTGFTQWPRGPQAAVTDDLRKMLLDLNVPDGKGGWRKAANKETEELLVEAFSANWRAKGLRSPFEAFGYILENPFDHSDIWGGLVAPPQTSPFLVDRMFTVVARAALHSSGLARKRYFRDRRGFKYAAGLASYMLLTQIPFVRESFPRVVKALQRLDASGRELRRARRIVDESQRRFLGFLNDRAAKDQGRLNYDQVVSAKEIDLQEVYQAYRQKRRVPPKKIVV